MEKDNNVFAKMRRFAGRKKRELERQISRDAKSYYRSYVANDSVSSLNEQLVHDILSYNPRSVLEFGCGVGKNLELLESKVARHLGIDLSQEAIAIAREKNLNAICGDETILKTIESYDVVFTCSVLDHIKDINEIVNDLKRITNAAIVIAETNSDIGRFYYPHDYESLGFLRTNYEYISKLAREEAVYHIWHWKLER